MSNIVFDKVICGLGNPEDKYKFTRHNIGWRIIDLLNEKFNTIKVHNINDLKGELYQYDADKKHILFVKSLTGMNLTGNCIKLVLNHYNILPNKLLIVLDDISLPFGKIRMRLQGSSGHHNGLSSIIGKIGTNKINRIKIGIDKPKDKSKLLEYVLGNFTDNEEKELPAILQHVIDSGIIPWIKEENPEIAMNQINSTCLK